MVIVSHSLKLSYLATKLQTAIFSELYFSSFCLFHSTISSLTFQSFLSKKNNKNKITLISKIDLKVLIYLRIFYSENENPSLQSKQQGGKHESIRKIR